MVVSGGRKQFRTAWLGLVLFVTGRDDPYGSNVRAFSLSSQTPPSPRKRSWNEEEIAGVWTFSSQEEEDKTVDNAIVYRLFPNGTFVRSSSSSSDDGGPDQHQYPENDGDEDEKEAVPSTRTDAPTNIQGVWAYRDRTLLLVVRDRCDTVLEGTVEARPRRIVPPSAQSGLGETTDGDEVDVDVDVDGHDVTLCVPRGRIQAGRLVYPTHHPSFFEPPMIYRPTFVGSFRMTQVLGILNASPSSSSPFSSRRNEPPPKFQPHDLYDKQFYMTVVPVPTKGETATQRQRNNIDKEDDDDDDPQQQRLFDLRVMPIRLFANNTFCAIGTNKILRGRFEIVGTDSDQLWFKVSRFGAGRSTPGSVYSEGKGLTHEDERSYRGTITREQRPDNDNDSSNNNDNNHDAAPPTKLTVTGTVFFGSDLGSDARPEPVGNFLMVETKEASMESNDKPDDNNDC